MDLDQHRQKRSRLRSADGSNDLSQRDAATEDDSVQAGPSSPARVLAATNALQNFSLQDSQPSAVQTHNPTPPASFLTHPSSHQNGAPTSNSSFNNNKNHAFNFTPPPSFSIAEHVAHNARPHPTTPNSLQAPSTRPGPGLHTFDLPLHGLRNLQASSDATTTASAKQSGRKTHNPPPQADSSRNQLNALPSTEPMLFLPQVHHPPKIWGKTLMILVQGAPRPQPFYTPSPQKREANSFQGISAKSSEDTGRSRLRTSNPPKGPSKPGIYAEAARDEVPEPGRWSHWVTTIQPRGNTPVYRVAADDKWPEDRLFPRSPPAHPPNHYTSPFRVENAATIAGRKRKRGWPALPPPAYIYKRTNSPNFNVFGGILLYPELCFALATNLPVNDLVSLYAISKDFHTIIDTRFATVIRSQAIRKCPESLRTFPARCYNYLCRPDPSPRIPHPHPAKQAAGEIRKVPSFRWLKMILFREKVCHEIMALMAEDGVPLPSRCELALKKMWFLMDIPDNARRIGYMHTTKLMTDLDLYFIMCFVVKLDMRFHDPMATNRCHGLRRMLLTQRGLLPLWRALKRTDLLTRSELLMMYVATKSAPVPDEEGLPMFGIAGEEIGKMRMEYWGGRSRHDTGKPCTFLLRPDQLFMREIVRRKMIFSKHFIRCLLWGYVNILTMKDYPSRIWDRRVMDMDDEYQNDDECGGYCERHGSVTNELLDLAAKKPVSMLVTKRDQSGVRKCEARQEAFLEECMKWYLAERQQT